MPLADLQQKVADKMGLFSATPSIVNRVMGESQKLGARPAMGPPQASPAIAVPQDTSLK